MRRNHPKSGNEMQPGPGRSKANLDFWSNRASENSIHPGDRSTKSGTGKDRPLNHEEDGGSSYMPNVRRQP